MIKSYKPTTPSQRSRKTLKRGETVDSPYKPLTSVINGSVGRNHGNISSRFREQGHKKKYRIIDFKRNKIDVPGKVATLEYDPNRNANIALINYADGEKRYILAPENLKVGMNVMSGESADFSVGNCLPLHKIPLGVAIHNIEINPGRGGQMVRSAGNSALVMAKEGNYVTIKLPSGELKQFQKSCLATIGTLSNADYRNIRLGKAGRNRHKGRRPHVRGVAMSTPTDHPHAGSYRDNGIGFSSPKTPWGKKTRGNKTRSRAHTNKYIVKDRRKK